MRVSVIKEDLREEKMSTKMLSQSQILKKMAAEAAAAADKLAAKKAAKVEKAQKRAAEAAAEQAAADKLHKETFENVMAQAVEEASKSVAGKQVLAMEAYARALRTMPMHIADNAGYDSADLIAGLRAKHFEGFHNYGLEMDKGVLADMNELGIREAFKVKSQVVLSASEAADMILRVDDIVQCAPRQRQ